jgi:hypothetical protein
MPEQSLHMDLETALDDRRVVAAMALTAAFLLYDLISSGSLFWAPVIHSF